MGTLCFFCGNSFEASDSDNWNMAHLVGVFICGKCVENGAVARLARLSVEVSALPSKKTESKPVEPPKLHVACLHLFEALKINDKLRQSWINPTERKEMTDLQFELRLQAHKHFDEVEDELKASAKVEKSCEV